MRLTFIVGTGRCGSTLLSRLLHTHPDMLSLNELFTPMRPRDVLPDAARPGRTICRSGIP
ncbi:sulfotransferase [Actinomadura sp. BRA 177]|uniref:sulfotransferase n=1 Tax=Actinomadura sp. BRA 177 TaxID=2745202 RepID=UPI0015959600|nr:sulfotransferase [Actinomadura sp. BRA 177]